MRRALRRSRMTPCNGQAMTEYAMILSTVTVVALVSYWEFGSFLLTLLGGVLGGL
jgi:Flp pilus assembly pilin Flp